MRVSHVFLHLVPFECPTQDMNQIHPFKIMHFYFKWYEKFLLNIQLTITKTTTWAFKIEIKLCLIGYQLSATGWHTSYSNPIARLNMLFAVYYYWVSQYRIFYEQNSLAKQGRFSWNVSRTLTSRTQYAGRCSILGKAWLNSKEIMINGFKFETDDYNIDIIRNDLSGPAKKTFLMHSGNDAGIDLLIIYHDWINTPLWRIVTSLQL